MSLETGTRIADLVATNPVGATDFASQGDDHIRLIKACLQGSFPSLGATAVAATAEQINALASLVAVSIIGRAANSTGAPAAITAAANDRILRRVADALDFGQLTAGMFPNTVVPDAALSSNVALKSATNNFTAQQQFQHAGGVLTNYVANYSAALVLEATGGFGISWKIAGNDAVTVSSARNVAIAAPASGSPLTVNARAAGGEIILQGATTAAIDLSIQNSGGYAFFGLESSAGGALLAGASAYACVVHAFNGQGVIVGNGNAVVARFDTGMRVGAPTGGDLGAGSVNAAGDVSVNNEQLGYKDLYLRSFSGSSNTAATDRGRAVSYSGTGGHTFTLDADIANQGTVTILNEGTADLTIAPSSSLNWMNGSGSISTGNRTLAVGGVAFAHSAGSGVWRIWGNGLS